MGNHILNGHVMRMRGTEVVRCYANIKILHLIAMITYLSCVNTEETSAYVID